MRQQRESITDDDDDIMLLFMIKLSIRSLEVHHQRIQVQVQRDKGTRNKRGQQARNSAIVALSEYDDVVALLPQLLSVSDMIATSPACSAKMCTNETHGGCATHNDFKFSTCCNHVKVVPPPVSKPPVILHAQFDFFSLPKKEAPN